MERIFVSHAASDEELVEDFVDLLQVGVGVHPDEIFCSSLPGMNIPTGTAFIEYIKSKIAKPELVLLIVSPEFLKSQFCNNEVGASWALSLPIHPLLAPPLDYSEVRGVLAGTQIGKLDDKESLNDLRDDLTAKLGLTPFRTSHWERKRDKFLSIVKDSPTTKATATPQVESQSSGEVLTSSGSWMKLGDGYFEALKFERRGASALHIEAEPKSSEQEATFNRLRPDPQGFRRDTIPFAFQNDGGFARVDNVSSVSQSGKNIWTFELTVEEIQGGHWTDMSFSSNGKTYTSDDVAELKAGRILINDPPPPARRRSRGFDHDFLESMVNSGMSAKVKTDECLIQRILKGSDVRHEDLVSARLEAVFTLKAAAIVEDILELSLGPVAEGGLPVKFRGVRHRRNGYEESETIKVSGVCNLGG